MFKNGMPMWLLFVILFCISGPIGIMVWFIIYFCRPRRR